MKIRGFFCLLLLGTVPVLGFAQDKTDAKREIEKEIRDVQKVRKSMAELYETIAKMSDKDWSATFAQIAKVAEADGLKENAAVFRELGKLENRLVTQNAIKKRLDGMSENGIGAVIWWWIHKWTNGRVISPFMDLPPWGTFLAIVLTLDAEKGENF